MKTLIALSLSILVFGVVGATPAFACDWWHPSGGGTNPCESSSTQNQ